MGGLCRLLVLAFCVDAASAYLASPPCVPGMGLAPSVCLLEGGGGSVLGQALIGGGGARRASATSAGRGRASLRMSAAGGDVWKWQGVKGGGGGEKERDVMGMLEGLHDVTGEFGTLLCSLEATGLAEQLREEAATLEQEASAQGGFMGKIKGMFGGQKKRMISLFAPTDSAFGRIPKDTLLFECVEAAKVPVAAGWRPGSHVLNPEDGSVTCAESGEVVEDGAIAKQCSHMEVLRKSMLGQFCPEEVCVEDCKGKSERKTMSNGATAVLDLRTATSAVDFTDYELDVETRTKVKVTRASQIVSADLKCSNGRLHVTDRILDGEVPLILYRAPQRQGPAMSEAELEEELAKVRARGDAIEKDLESLQELVDEGTLSRRSARELGAVYEGLARDEEGSKKRAERDQREAGGEVVSKTLRDIIGVLDAFEMSKQAYTDLTPSEENVVKGYSDVEDSLIEAIKGHGVELIEAMGMPFDPLSHEAVQMRESTEYPDGTVCQQYQRGYSVAGKIVRAATVVVSNGPGPEVAAAAPEAAGDVASSEDASEADSSEEGSDDAAKASKGGVVGGGGKVNLAKERALQANKDQWGIEEPLR